MEMIHDCEAGKIDMIITKHVSRFARNIVDCIKIERDLKKLNPPVGVFFETENLFTLDEDSEVMLSIMAMMAQEESHTKSEIMNASIEMRFRRGIFLTPTLLGYNKDAEGNLVINEDEAKIVRLIFYMYLDGYTCQQIADTLTNFGQKTKKGNDTWSAGTILQILQNERHCGDVLARKTFTPSYLDHKSKKNRQDRNQYIHRDNHEAIISRDDFIAVQRLIANAKYGNKGILPELRVISGGTLKGYVSVNPRWSGFTASDYRAASNSVAENAPAPAPLQVTAQSGDFDFRGYEVARAEFFDTHDRISVTFSSDNIKFSTEAVRKFERNPYIEMLIHPVKRMFAVRSCTSETRNKVQWAKIREEVPVPRPISGSAFLPTLFDLFDWNNSCKYRIIGLYRKK
jgi:DNA invertase Pin-like site-specific DNA recombinase